MIRKILHKRGAEADLPALDASELAFTTDSNNLYVGNGTENIQLAKEKDLKNLRSDWEDSNQRDVIFVCPGRIPAGVQEAIIPIPKRAVALGIKAIIAAPSTEDVVLKVQYSTGLAEWNDLSTEVTIAEGFMTDNGSHSISELTLEEDTFLRIFVVSNEGLAQSLTSSIAIKYI